MRITEHGFNEIVHAAQLYYEVQLRHKYVKAVTQKYLENVLFNYTSCFDDATNIVERCGSTDVSQIGLSMSLLKNPTPNFLCREREEPLIDIVRRETESFAERLNAHFKTNFPHQTPSAMERLLRYELYRHKDPFQFATTVALCLVFAAAVRRCFAMPNRNTGSFLLACTAGFGALFVRNEVRRAEHRSQFFMLDPERMYEPHSNVIPRQGR